MKQFLLIAEGDPQLGRRYCQFLSRRGYAADRASDGLDCIRKMRQVRPAMLLLDLALHWGGGDGVLAWLREEEPARWVPVVLTTTADSPEHVAELVKPPVVHCLHKPVPLTALLKSVRSAVATGQQLAHNAFRGSTPLDLHVG